MTVIFRKSEKNVAQNYLGQVSVSVSLFHRTLLGYYAEWMHANCFFISIQPMTELQRKQARSMH